MPACSGDPTTAGITGYWSARIAASTTGRSYSATVARELHAIETELAGRSDAPNALNLRGKINWLRIQVGGYTGRPTPSQREWVARFTSERDRLASELQHVL